MLPCSDDDRGDGRVGRSGVMTPAKDRPPPSAGGASRLHTMAGSRPIGGEKSSMLVDPATSTSVKTAPKPRL